MSVSIVSPAGIPSSVSTEGLSVPGAEPTALLELHQPPSLSQHHARSGKAACQSECEISGGLWCCTVTKDGLFSSFMAAWVPWGGFAWFSDGVSRCQVKLGPACWPAWNSHGSSQGLKDSNKCIWPNLSLDYLLNTYFSLEYLYFAGQKWLSDQVFCSHLQAFVAAHLLVESWFI